MDIIRTTLAGALLAMAACGHSELPVATTTTTGGMVNQPAGLNAPQGLVESPPVVVLADDAASQIASVRCSREDACGNVGAVGTFPSFDACIDVVRHAHRLELSEQACPRGIDPYALQACIEAARVAGCGQIDAACASSRLCR